ncbi:MAG: acetyltransferase [Thermodesulfobacteriota bacterium]
MDYDVFNGDADGICALQQLRLAEPRAATLVTGVKRDIRLLRRIDSDDCDRLTVLDISLDSNRDDLLRLLPRCRQAIYVDHHFAGDIPVADHFTAHIDPAPDVCTSLIVDRLLGGRYRAWAVAAAYGDNLHEAAAKAARTLSLPADRLAALRELGELLNYNGYGRTVADLHVAPDRLFLSMRGFDDPFAFIGSSPVLPTLRQGFHDDMARARSAAAEVVDGVGRLFHFPDSGWARRVAGVFSNEIARERPDLAHALLVDNGDGTLMASVRAPLSRKNGADELCRAFPTGGGRAGAAGINALPTAMLADFQRAFAATFSRSTP